MHELWYSVSNAGLELRGPTFKFLFSHEIQRVVLRQSVSHNTNFLEKIYWGSMSETPNSLEEDGNNTQMNMIRIAQ